MSSKWKSISAFLFFFCLQTRNHYESTCEELEELMKRMKRPSQISKMHNFMPMEGYLYCQEKCKCDVYACAFVLDLNCLDGMILYVSLFHQGLWVCHGSNTIVGITQRGDC